MSDSTPSQVYSALDDSSVPEYLVCSLLYRFGRPSLTFRPVFSRQCGGAQERARPKTLKRRRQRADRSSQAGPSNHTGSQTAKKRKPGSRVTKDFGGDGKTLNDGTPGASGAGFRKRTQRYGQALNDGLLLGLTQLHSNRAREERAIAAEKRVSALLQKQTIKGEFSADACPFAEVYPVRASAEQPSDDDNSSGSDEEVEFVKIERDDDRRKALLDSLKVGDSSLEQLKQQSKLDDYTGFFRLPESSHEAELMTTPDSHSSTEGPPAVGAEVIDLSLSTDDEGGDAITEDVTPTTGSPAGADCDVQGTVTATSVTDKAHDPSNGKWACPICTLYAPFSYVASPPPPSPRPIPTVLHFSIPIFISSIPHRHKITDRRFFFLFAGRTSQDTLVVMPVGAFGPRTCELEDHRNHGRNGSQKVGCHKRRSFIACSQQPGRFHTRVKSLCAGVEMYNCRLVLPRM